MSDTVKVLVFPPSLSSWRVMIALEEVRCPYLVETVDLFQWEHLRPEHLRLCPLGSVPVMVTVRTGGAPGRGEDAAGCPGDGGGEGDGQAFP